MQDVCIEREAMIRLVTAAWMVGLRKKKGHMLPCMRPEQSETADRAYYFLVRCVFIFPRSTRSLSAWAAIFS